jgi:hypothetical protein
MSLKEFLKPDWRKIVIFLILFILSTTSHIGYNYVESSPLPSILTVVGGKESTCPPDCINFYKINRIIWPFYPFYSMQKFSSSPESTVFVEYELLMNPNSYGPDLNGYILLILNSIYWYLISCLIVWVYDKVKKKK